MSVPENSVPGSPPDALPAPDQPVVGTPKVFSTLLLSL